MVDRMGTAEQTAAQMSRALAQSCDYIGQEVRAVFRGMESFGISEREARRILNSAGNKTALQTLRDAANRLPDEKKRAAMLSAIDSAGAYRFRIDRLEQLGKTIDSECRRLYQAQNKAVTSALETVAEDSYYHSIFNLQQQTGLGFGFAEFSRRDADKILRHNWYGQNYSQRIWNDLDKLSGQLKQELLISTLTGRSHEKTMRVFRERFGVNAYCARRIVRTESAYVTNAAQKSAYDEAGIDRYRFVATLDSRTSEECAELDGAVFAVSEAKAGTNYPPMHPFCRSTTVAEFGEGEYKALERRARGEDGKVVRVPADMTYEEWKKSLDKSGGSGIIKNIELPSETDVVRSMSIETKRLISDAFDKILADYDVRVDEIVTKPLKANEKNVPFQFQPVAGAHGELIKRIVINSDYDFMGSQKEFQKRIMRNFNSRALASNSIDGLIAHEMAHVMTFQDISTFSGYLLENKIVAKCEALGISRYADASLDGAEHIAEAFAAKRCGVPISDDAQALLNKYIERWKK